MTAAAFQATIHGFRTVPSRGVVSITIEAPIEHHAQIARIAEHGSWVAVARIQEPKQGEAHHEVTSQESAAAGQSQTSQRQSSKTPWRDLPPSQQAAMRCNEPAFAAFLKENHGYAGEDVPQAVRELCCVTSRAELNANNQARVLWHQLDNQFQAWKAAEHA